jgi:2-dehydropantoate 2-reductase
VYGVCVVCPAGHLQPGVVQAWSTPTTGLLDLGRYPAGVDDFATTVASVFRGATFASEARHDIMRWKYTKLLSNLGNAIEALCGPAARSTPLAETARAEGVACLRAAGIAYVSGEDDAARRATLRLRPIGGARRPGGSSWQSLARRTHAIEADYLNGEIVLLGRLHGVPTPVNALLQRLANEMARKGAPPGTMTVDEIARALPAPMGHPKTDPAGR